MQLFDDEATALNDSGGDSLFRQVPRVKVHR
jgi:hypothetical protein